jgi:hypothetical protein
MRVLAIDNAIDNPVPSKYEVTEMELVEIIEYVNTNQGLNFSNAKATKQRGGHLRNSYYTEYYWTVLEPQNERKEV